jgi:hypothetical protein
MKAALIFTMAALLSPAATAADCWTGRADVLTANDWIATPDPAGDASIDIAVTNISGQHLRSVLGRAIFLSEGGTVLSADLPYLMTVPIAIDAGGTLVVTVPAEQLPGDPSAYELLVCAQIVTFADGTRRML